MLFHHYDDAGKDETIANIYPQTLDGLSEINHYMTLHSIL